MLEGRRRRQGIHPIPRQRKSHHSLMTMVAEMDNSSPQALLDIQAHDAVGLDSGLDVIQYRVIRD